MYNVCREGFMHDCAIVLLRGLLCFQNFSHGPTSSFINFSAHRIDYDINVYIYSLISPPVHTDPADSTNSLSTAPTPDGVGSIQPSLPLRSCLPGDHSFLCYHLLLLDLLLFHLLHCTHCTQQTIIPSHSGGFL